MSKANLTLLLELEAQERRDQRQDPVFLHRRDRRYALDNPGRTGSTADLQHWLQHLQKWSGQQQRSGDRPGVTELTVPGRCNRLFAGLGAVLGLFAMTGLLVFDGGQRINLTVILGFIALQLMLALATTLQSLAGWNPWGPALGALHRWTGLSADPASDRSGVVHHLRPHWLAGAAQLGGLCLAVTAWLTLMVSGVLQDLAFGWSTTLSAASEPFYRLVSLLAAPWQSLFPDAVPSLALVQDTRFYRADGSGNPVDPQRWGQWWPFVSLVWLCYVILPRLLLWLLSQALLKRATGQLLRHHPAVTALRYRMETATLDTGNQHNDGHHEPDLNTDIAPQPLPQAAAVIRWAAAGDNPGQTPWPPQLPLFSAGGRQTLEQDQATLQAADQHLRNAGRQPAVLVVARAWEPPTGELADFLQEGRDHWPDDTRIALLPLDVSGQPPGLAMLAPWQRFVRRHARLILCQPGGAS